MQCSIYRFTPHVGLLRFTDSSPTEAGIHFISKIKPDYSLLQPRMPCPTILRYRDYLNISPRPEYKPIQGHVALLLTFCDIGRKTSIEHIDMKRINECTANTSFSKVTISVICYNSSLTLQPLYPYNQDSLLPRGSANMATGEDRLDPRQFVDRIEGFKKVLL